MIPLLEAAPLPRRRILRLAFWTACAGLWGLTALILWLRFSSGLDRVSNMSDRFPWGLWISFDLASIALSAGGFAIAASVHLFHLKKFEPILRPTVLTAFLGYAMASTAVLLDVGRPQRIWHPMIMWQRHSVMFDVAWCIMLYSTVLALEFAPVILEKFNQSGWLDRLKRISLPVVLLGVVLSTMHQSSLGSLYLLVPEKLHPLWFSPALPVLFFASAVAGGLALVVLETLFLQWYFRRQAGWEILEPLARAVSKALFLYAGLKVLDLAWRWRALSANLVQFESLLWLLEWGLGALLPACLLSLEQFRSSAGRLAVPCLAAVGGVVLNRLNVTWFGLMRSSGMAYFPQWMEVISTLGILAAGMAAFVWGSRFFPVFDKKTFKSAHQPA